MTDYIKREYDEWCTGCKEYDKERHCCPRWNKVIRDTVDEIRQNADVRENVKGKWKIEYTGDGWNDYIDVTCTNCGKTIKHGELYNFCPNCGAQMKEGDT